MVEKSKMGWTRGSGRERGGDRWVSRHQWNDLCPTFLGLHFLQAPWVDRHRQQEVVGQVQH